MPVTHTKVSIVADGAVATDVKPSDWDAAHAGICSELALSNRVIVADFLVPQGYAAEIASDVEIASGFVLEVGIDGIMEVS